MLRKHVYRVYRHGSSIVTCLPSRWLAAAGYFWFANLPSCLGPLMYDNVLSLKYLLHASFLLHYFAYLSL
jgi:hypothetical protein